jgi:branched-chain amino acid aminotransferase
VGSRHRARGRIDRPSRADSWNPHDPVPRGIRLGDGVFETIRTYRGRPFGLEPHLRRLVRGARSIGLTRIPSIERLRHEVLVELAGLTRRRPGAEWVVRPMVYAAEHSSRWTVAIEPYHPARPRGAGRDRVGISRYPHPGAYLAPSGEGSPVKWLARGPLAHALRDAVRRGWTEALLCDSEGRVVEGTRSNIFVLADGGLYAPGPASRALAGITRGIVLTEARRRGLKAWDRPIDPSMMRRATEVFLTSTLLGVQPVRRIEGWALPRLDPRAPWTRTLSEALTTRMEAETSAPVPSPAPGRRRSRSPS